MRVVNIVKNQMVPLIIGVIYILTEFMLMMNNSSTKILIICFAIGIGISVITISIYKRYEACGWITIISCGGLAFYYFILLLQPNIMLDYNAIILIVINWISIVITCVIFRFLDNHDKIRGFKGFFRISSTIFLIIYLGILTYSLFFGSPSRVEMRQVNLIPFTTILPYINGTSNTNQEVSVVNLIANIFLFIPLGFYLSIIFRRLRLLIRIIIILTIPLFIEIAQYIFEAGVSDVDDVILNFFGGVIGMMLLYIVEKVYSMVRKNDDEKLFKI